jgi:hypothetical protein
MDQALTTVSAAPDQAASDATEQTSPAGRARATLPRLSAPRLPVVGVVALGPFGLSAFPLLRVAEPPCPLLYRELEPEANAGTAGRIQGSGPPFACRLTGAPCRSPPIRRWTRA